MLNFNSSRTRSNEVTKQKSSLSLDATIYLGLPFNYAKHSNVLKDLSFFFLFLCSSVQKKDTLCELGLSFDITWHLAASAIKFHNFSQASDLCVFALNFAARNVRHFLQIIFSFLKFGGVQEAHQNLVKLESWLEPRLLAIQRSYQGATESETCSR